jgi:hypothetical protein
MVGCREVVSLSSQWACQVEVLKFLGNKDSAVCLNEQTVGTKFPQANVRSPWTPLSQGLKVCGRLFVNMMKTANRTRSTPSFICPACALDLSKRN